MIVGSPLFEAYLECSTKCWLRARDEPRTGTTYTEWARLKNETYYDEGRKRLLARFSESDRTIAPAISKNAKDVIQWRVATHVLLQANGLESHLQAIEKVSSEGWARPVQLIPYRFQFTNRLTKNDKLSLAFDALVLSEAMGCDLGFGKIMHGDGHVTCKVKLNSLVNTVRTEITGLTALLADTSPPDLVLNRHCPQCEFQARCREQATKKDERRPMSEKTLRKVLKRVGHG